MNKTIASLFRRAERRRTLDTLMSLDDRILTDIGINRTDIALMRAGRIEAGPRYAHE